MSRPEDLPRSASPLKRRAPSVPLEDDPDAADDVDMLALPPSATTENTSTVDGKSIEDVKDGVREDSQEENPDSPRDDASTAAQADDVDEDLPSLTGLDMDRASVEETQVGSDLGDVAPTADNPGGIDAQEQDAEQSKEDGQDAGAPKVAVKNESSTTNSDDAADSDSKTADTVATSTSVDGAAKNASLLGSALDSGTNGKLKGNRSGRNSPAPPGPLTRGRQAKSDRVKGLTGLGNLGNTCYMNSALQCIRSVEELTKYFLTEMHVDELNYDNPLGHSGQVALAYANLLAMIYRRDPPPPSVSPRSFKETVGRYAPQFSGWQQQDTQEFLGFLLDGLQEDLNRVKKKPYIEKPDSTDDMVGNREKEREMASKVWDICKARDDSVIGDLFFGMYKSTLVCPTCSKISITFEPFTSLSLPLPVQNIWLRKVKFFPLNDRPVNIIIEIDKSASIKAMKGFLSTRTGVPVERIVGAEEYKDKFFKIYEDYQQAAEEIQKEDFPCFFEVEAPPTNLSFKKRKTHKISHLSRDDDLPSPDDPLNEEMSKMLLVPVVHRFNPRLNSQTRLQGPRSSENVSPPHFIVLNPEEARDDDVIRRKILEKVATFTTYRPLTSLHNGQVTETSVQDAPAEQEPSLINASDADSARDSGVVAKSVEGEDDIVDVSMEDAPGKSPVQQQDAEKPSTLLKKFNTRRPDWIDPSVFLDGQFQQMFDMSFFSENTTVATGWMSVGANSDRLYPRLDTRKPRPSSPSDEDMPSPSGSGTASEESSTEETPEPAAAAVFEPATRMLEESSEEDGFPDVKDLPHRSQPKLRGGKKMKQYKTYSKKGQKRFNKQQRQQRQQQQQARQSYQQQNNYSLFDDEDGEWGSKADGGPLVRLGDGIVVDWDPEAWDKVFGLPEGAHDNKAATLATYFPEKFETLSDPHLEAKIQARRSRSSKGISLEDCLDEFEKEEILSEEDKWYCPKCKEFRRAAKKFDLWRTPDILIVHLKRFSSSGHRRDKIDATVDFPIEGLDISSRVLETEDGQQEVYDLIAVDDHMGGMGAGHYTAFAKNFEDSGWYKFDDSSVAPVRDTSRMITSHAYLLFYRRRSDQPLGGQKLEEACRLYAQASEEVDEDEPVNSNEGAESR